MRSRQLIYILFGIILSFWFFAGLSYAEKGGNGDAESVIKEEAKGAQCPVTTITDQFKCYDCHEMRLIGDDWKWTIKPQKHRSYRNLFEFPSYIYIEDGEFKGIYEMEGQISVVAFRIFVEYMYEQGIKDVTIDISSGGGSLIEGWECCSLIGQMINRGIHVTTQVRAYCASAAFLVFVAGQERLVEPTAYMMTHELWTLAFLKLETPSSKEDEAITMRMFQNTIHEWLAERSGTSKAKLDEMVRHKDWWMTGKAAVKQWKFADGYIK